MSTKGRGMLLGVLMAVFAVADARAADAAPGEAVKAATEKMQALIKQRHAEFVANKPAFYATVDEVITPAFDLPYVAQITLGRAWRTASDEQKARFQKAFKTTLIHAYADTLLENSEFAQFEWVRSGVAGDGANLHANVLRNSGPPVAMGFELHKTSAGDWRAYDVSVEGISLISNFRSQFSSEVKRDGLDALIKRLEAGS